MIESMHEGKGERCRGHCVDIMAAATMSTTDLDGVPRRVELTGAGEEVAHGRLHLRHLHARRVGLELFVERAWWGLRSMFYDYARTDKCGGVVSYVP